VNKKRFEKFYVQLNNNIFQILKMTDLSAVNK